MSSNTLTLQTSINWASFFTGNRPLTLQGGLEPALTSANIIIQSMLSPPFKWRWNRNLVTFLTIDPAGWKATTFYAAGNRIIDSNGKMQTVTVTGTSGGTQPTWAATGTTTDGGVTWTASLVSDYLQAVPDFGYIEKASVGNSAGIFEIPNKTQELTSDAGIGRFQSIAPYLDDNQGNITFRHMPGIPDASYTETVIYQKRMVLLTAASGAGGIWPIPDIYAHVYNAGFLGMVWLFADDMRAAFMLQRFAALVIAISDGLTEQEKNSFLEQWDVMNASKRASAKAGQGLGARASS